MWQPTSTFSKTVSSWKSVVAWKVRTTPRAAIRLGRSPGYLAAAEHDVASGRLVVAADDVEGRGLAGAVRADQPVDLALVHSEGKIVDGGEAAEMPGQFVNFE